MKTQVKKHFFLGLFLYFPTSPFVAVALCDLKERDTAFLKYLGFKFTSYLIVNSVWPVMTHCPMVPGNFTDKGTDLRRKTQMSPTGHLSNHLLDSGSLSWAKGHSQITHCETICDIQKWLKFLQIAEIREGNPINRTVFQITGWVLCAATFLLLLGEIS